MARRKKLDESTPDGQAAINMRRAARSRFAKYADDDKPAPSPAAPAQETVNITDEQESERLECPFCHGSLEALAIDHSNDEPAIRCDECGAMGPRGGCVDEAWAGWADCERRKSAAQAPAAPELPAVGTMVLIAGKFVPVDRHEGWPTADDPGFWAEGLWYSLDGEDETWRRVQPAASTKETP